ncbi:MAG TPA: diguanylate cyclase [Candidatus Paceibacterota bacterium]|nr:diguanylate cyclase [Candidatus Paceibacterota bacterium]HMO82888.1 diguanylate cyclase [Candidatus Paceibacterota bacterium]
MESIKSTVESREKAIELSREEFEEKAKNVAKEYGVTVEEVLYLYALKSGKQVEKNMHNEVLLQKIFKDHLIEDIYWESVHEHLKYNASEQHLVAELSRTEDELNQETVRRVAAEKAATIDRLTGLPNRRAFEVKLKEVIDIFNEKKVSFSVIVLDIDNFKGINDKFGHPVGDDVLRAIGKVIYSCLRGTDFAARYGGEELAVIVETNEEQARKLQQRIETAISEIDPLTVGVDPNIRSQITASFGVAEYDPETQNIPGQDVVSRADQAMYRNKESKKIRME